MPLRRLPGPPDLERVVAVLGRTPPTSARMGWVPEEPLVPGGDGPAAEAAEKASALAIAHGVTQPVTETARPDKGQGAAASLGPAGRGRLRAQHPGSRDARGRPDEDTSQLDAQLRTARRPGVFTVPESIRHGRVAVSSAAVVAVLALVVAVACAFAVRVLWAERAAGDALAPHPRDTGVVSVQRAVGTSPEQTDAGPLATQSAGTQLVVHVVGQVKRPGLVRLKAGARVADAIAAAGGAKATSDLSLLNLARPVVDGEQVHVPRPGEAVPSGGAGGGPGGTAPAGGVAGPGATGVVNLNTADLSALDTLPGVGPVLAQRILDWRSEHGRFASVEELAEVSGIGDKLYAQIRPKVTV